MLLEHQLIPYQTTNLPQKPLLVFAPHPDDEIFGMGGALIKAKSQGLKITIVYVTSGDLGGESLVREREAKGVCRSLEAQCLFIRLGDRGVIASRENIIKFKELISEYPDSAIYFPSPKEYHPDHRATAALVWRGAQEATHRNELVAYEISGQSDANILLDVSDYYDEKLKLMSGYASQLDQNDYVSIVKGLNKARTYTLSKEVEYAEAFFVFDSIWGQLKKRYQLIQHKAFDDILPYERPKISIVIRTKDRLHLLERALESLKKQNYNRHLEVIVVNDGGELVNEVTDPYIFVFSELKLINLPLSLGRSGSANVGLINSTGQFINFLDDDDEFNPNHIQVFLNHWRQNTDIDVLYRGVEVISESGEIVQVYNEPYRAGKLMQSNYIPIHSVTFSRKFVDLGCRFDESLDYMEDWDFWIQISRLSKFHHVPQITAKYHMVGNSAASPHMHGTLDHVCHMNRVRDKWMNKWSSVERSRMLNDCLQAEKDRIAS